jgi:hypothetical protein
MNKVNLDQLGQIDHDTYVAESSTLRWPPGYFPRVFEMDGKLFIRQFSDEGSVLYKQSGFNVYVKIFND